jgi:branched chain amino acid efflux pump
MARSVALVIVILVVGAGTYVMRAVPLALGSRARLSAGVERWLSFVTPAILGALLGPLLLTPDGATLIPPWANAALLAAIPTAVVARLSRNLLATIAAGVLCYAALVALLAWIGVTR